jgi:branched-chain amino acid transport system ATP-binding protein
MSPPQPRARVELPVGTKPLLEVSGLCAYYDDLQALYDVNLVVMPGEIVSIVGANAAGKSTILRALSGLISRTGALSFDGEDLTRHSAHEIVDLGLVHVPEGRELFPFMTIEENLDVGAYTPRARARSEESKRAVFELLPKLADRRSQLAHTLSGGEQQMCALGRGLMALPKMLLLGLAPVIVQTLYEKLVEINAAGTTVLLVEQNLKAALKLSDRAYVLETGHIVLDGAAAELIGDERIKSAYLGR